MFLRKIIDVKRLILISPELLTGILVYLIYSEYPTLFGNLAASLEQTNSLPTLIGAIELGTVIGSYKIGMKILRPGKENENKVLYSWPMYWALEVRVYWAMLLCALCCGVTLFAYLNPVRLAAPAQGVLMVGAILISVVAVGSLVLAQGAIRKLLTLHK